MLDACTPRQVRLALAGHEVATAQACGWGELENGQLLAAAEAAGFDVLVICDKNLRYQQNLAGRRLALVELWTNHWPTLERHLPVIRAAVEACAAGDYRVIDEPPVA